MRRPRDSLSLWFTAPAFVMATTAVIFVAVALSLTLRLREDLRAQILRREAEAMRSMVGLQQARAEDELARFGLGAEPGDWFPLLLETYRLRGVLALRLFDTRGTLRDALPMPAGASISPEDWSRLDSGESFARLHQTAALESLRTGEDSDLAGGVPLLEVLVPLQQPADRAFGGVAQYWIDGAAMQAEFARLDRNLWWRSGVSALVGAAIVLASLAWAFNRLRRANRDLQARTSDLAQANREFSLAAKTSAVGAITAHLIHGLRNPLAGLEGYVSNQPHLDDGDNGHERRMAVETTQRIRALMNEVMSILREEQSGSARYRVTTAELLEAMEAKIRPLATARGIQFIVHHAEQGELTSRRAHLILLVLDNLLRNACEATPPGGRVTLRIDGDPRDAIFIVEDEGPGLGPDVRGQLFQPVTSTKPGGGGIGLVLSHNLAQHAGGRLTLEKSDSQGCRFQLAVPLETTAGVLAQ